jgi:beta-barrel assembly-enhancing protease
MAEYHIIMRISNLLVLFLLFASPVFADGLPDLGDTAQLTVSPQMERRVGEEAMRDIRLHDPKFDNDAEATAYLNSLGDRLVSNSAGANQRFEFFLVKDPTLNAFALPGGFVGVNTGTIVTAQSESELAAVLSHEIAHVTQHHMARMASRDGKLSVAMLAAMALAIVARNSQVGSAVATIGQASAITTQIGYSREYEREADRIGFQTLRKSGFDVRAMPEFFLRMQREERLSADNAPIYLRDHPVTTERIADAENRIQSLPYKQVPDSMDFQLVRAKLRAQQGEPRHTLARLEADFREQKFSNEIAARYGVAVALLRTQEPARAAAELAPLLKTVDHPMIAALNARIKGAGGDDKGALAVLTRALVRYPDNRELNYECIETMQQLGQYRNAQSLLDQQIASFPHDLRLFQLRAKNYSAQGKRLLAHQAQAEAYVLQGSLPAAIEQLQLAQKSGDGDFYQLSSVDARLRDLRAELMQQKKDNK